jgi:sec-independent protein translocase protein TatA
MFGVSHFYELVLVLAIALVFFGPRRLPELGASLGRGIREFRTATRELQAGVADDAPPSSPVAQVPEGAHDGSAFMRAAPDTALPPHDGAVAARP